MSEKVIKLKVITPTRVFFEGEAESFIVKTRGEVGEFAVLVDHAPMAAAVGLGTLVINLPSGEKKTSTLFDGYAVVQENTAVIIAEAAEWPDEIDIHRAEEAKIRAERRIHDNSQDIDRAELAMKRAMLP